MATGAGAAGAAGAAGVAAARLPAHVRAVVAVGVSPLAVVAFIAIAQLDHVGVPLPPHTDTDTDTHTCTHTSTYTRTHAHTHTRTYTQEAGALIGVHSAPAPSDVKRDDTPTRRHAGIRRHTQTHADKRRHTHTRTYAHITAHPRDGMRGNGARHTCSGWCFVGGTTRSRPAAQPSAFATQRTSVVYEKPDVWPLSSSAKAA